MKKIIIILLVAIVAALSEVNAQTPAKKDSTKSDTVQISMPIDEYKAFEQALNANIDSKTATKQLIDFLRARLRLVQQQPQAQPADKPKK